MVIRTTIFVNDNDNKKRQASEQTPYNIRQNHLYIMNNSQFVIIRLQRQMQK